MLNYLNQSKHFLKSCKNWLALDINVSMRQLEFKRAKLEIHHSFLLSGGSRGIDRRIIHHLKGMIKTVPFLAIFSVILDKACFRYFFIFHQMVALQKLCKSCSFHLKSFFRSQVIHIFVTSSLPLLTFQIQKDKWKWNNLWCHSWLA